MILVTDPDGFGKELVEVEFPNMRRVEWVGRQRLGGCWRLPQEEQMERDKYKILACKQINGILDNAHRA